MPTSTVPQPRLAEDERVLALLAAHVPLSLLLDLAEADPHSREIYERERVTAS